MNELAHDASNGLPAPGPEGLAATCRCGLIAAVLVGVLAAPCGAILGFGKKKAPPPAEEGKKAAEGMPGMSAGEGGEARAEAPASGGELPGFVPGGGRDRAAASPGEGGDGSPAPFPGEGSKLPTEVVIKGSDSGSRVPNQKPPLSIEVDPFESIRASLEPDENLLLADSPFTVSWRRTHPEFLRNPRVIHPWRTTFSERAGIAFDIREQLQDALQRALEPKEARAFQWSLTIADEEGRVFQRYEGSKDPPEELVWTGQNDQGEWIRAGRSYSAVYVFTDSGGTPYTKVGKPIQFTGIVHQESNGLQISLDSSALFGANKAEKALTQPGEGLLRSAADLIKRKYNGIPMRVVVYANTPELAQAQAGEVQAFLARELMASSRLVSTEALHGPFSEQRVDVVLLNR